MVAEVKRLETAADIPAMLRDLARAIEAGEYGPVKFIVAAVVPQHSEEPSELFCWGTASNLEIAGTLALSHHRMFRRSE